MLSFRRTTGVALVATILVASCKPADSNRRQMAGSSDSVSAAPAAEATTITVTAKDFSFDAPTKVPAGAVAVHLVNQGSQLHHSQLVKLEDGKTMKDLAQAMKTPGPPPSWVKFVGGPNAVVPGKEATTTSVLEPGHYAMICFIPGADGVSHVNKGMAREFDVTDSEAGTAAASLPQPDVTVKLVDYGFEPSQPLSAGRRTILVDNVGPQPHELVLLKLAPGKKVEDFAGWAEHMKGPPPGEPIGGVVFLDKGGKATFTADLEKGDYGFMCFYPDHKDGKPHLAHGMMQTITVS